MRNSIDDCSAFSFPTGASLTCIDRCVRSKIGNESVDNRRTFLVDDLASLFAKINCQSRFNLSPPFAANIMLNILEPLRVPMFVP